MKLITPELQSRFNEIGDQSEIKNPIIIAKFFDPVGSASWYATEYNPETNICFGYVANLVPDLQGRFDEWGTFSIDELESIRRPLGLFIERDIYFKESHFNDLLEKKRVPEIKQEHSEKQKNQELEL